MSYRIELSEQDMYTIAFVGGRYAWSDVLYSLADCFRGEGGCPTSPVTLVLAEHEAWELSAAFESDTEGGHSLFPMLDGRSELASKLHSFMQSIV